MSDLIGKTIGQYQIVEQIGLGGMATVYKAYQPSIDRFVAVKILPQQLARDPNFVKRFQHEAKAIAGLEHPHILPVHDFGTDGGHTYMVMRYVEGGTLTDLMGQTLSYERIVEIVGNIARALDYAHREGVVHRDIKPSNILIDLHGEQLLTDFGIAKMVAGSGDTQLTSAGSILGTPAYMAPEQAEGKAVDGRTDIYALGVVLYELLTGRPPYQAETPLAIVLMHVNDPLPPPRTIKANVPEPLERVVLKAMAKDPGQRFQSAADMEKALKQALKEIEEDPRQTAVPARSPKTESLAQPPAPAKKRGLLLPLLLAGGILVLLLCVVGGGITLWALMASSDGAGEDTPVAAEAVQPNLPATPASTATSSPTNTPPPAPSSTPTPPDNEVGITSPPEEQPISATPAESEDSVPVGLPPFEGEILFQDQFDSNENEWSEGEEIDEYGRYEPKIVDGRYRLSHEADQGVFIWEEPAGVEFDDFALSVEAIPVESSAAFAYGLVFRSSLDQELYAFEVDSDGYFFINRLDNGSWEGLVEFTPMAAINADGPNQLTVAAQGSTMSFFINDEEAITIQDDSLASGAIGVALELYEEGDSATVDFDNLVVRQLGEAAEAAEAAGDDGIIFADYFDSDVNGWAIGEFEDDYTYDEITIEDGVYRLSIEASQSAYVEQELPNQSFSDFVLTVEATPQDTEEHYSYGLSFRVDENYNSYTFEIGNDGLYTIQVYDGEWRTLKDWSSAEAINAGETNELMVIADGSSLTFLVNGEQLTQLEDDTLTAGTVGLVVDIFEEDSSVTVEFDNLVIRELGYGH